MSFATTRRAVFVAAIAAASACTVHDTTPPSLSGPSGPALTVRVAAVPSSLSYGITSVQNGEQAAVTVTALGADGRGIPQLPIRMNIVVDGNAQDFGAL